MKKIIACLCAAALAISMSACGRESTAETGADPAYANAVLTGQVQEATETSVTLLLGELTEEADQPGGQQPPERPEEDGGGAPDGEDVPSKPDGQPPEMGGRTTFTPGAQTVTLTVSEEALGDLANIAADDVIQVETNADGEIVTISVVDLGQGGPGEGAGAVEQGSAAYTIAADGDYTGETYRSTGDDENALRIDGAAVTLDAITVEKESGATSNTESGDFYGMNAALLATNGAEVTITNAAVTSSAQNGNGVFSYGEGTVVNLAKSTIHTTADNSGGIQTTGGGTTNATDLTVETEGSSSAAIRSDRGGGTVHVTGGSYTSSGLNSPAVYSTADITVKNAVLTANHSEALVIEGQNSISLENCTVSGNMSETQGSSSDVNVHNVMIYQSMSGDAEVGTSSFSMQGGSLTGRSGDMIYVTNTSCVIDLSGVEIQNEDADGALLRVTGNDASHGWGTAGSNGGHVTLTASAQALTGDMVVDSISTLDLTLAGGSVFTGTVQIVENSESGAAVSDNAVVTVGEGCTWNLTGDCVITSLDNQGTVNYNGYTITLADGAVLNG